MINCPIRAQISGFEFERNVQQLKIYGICEISSIKNTFVWSDSVQLLQ